MVNETIIRLREDNIVEIESLDTNDTKVIKIVTFNDLVTAMTASVSSKEKKELYMSSNILPVNIKNNVYTIYTRVYDNGNKVVGLYQPAHRTSITYYDTKFNDVGIPGLVYAISYNIKEQVTRVRIGVVCDEFLTNETEMYEYPFSNVSGGTGNVCFGRNNIFDIRYRSEVDLHSIPQMFLAMPNNDDSYGKNNSGLSHRKLLEHLEGKDFPKEFLTNVNRTSKTKTLDKWFEVGGF